MNFNVLNHCLTLKSRENRRKVWFVPGHFRAQDRDHVKTDSSTVLG